MDRTKQITYGLGLAAIASAVIYFTVFFSPVVSKGKAQGY